MNSFASLGVLDTVVPAAQQAAKVFSALRSRRKYQLKQAETMDVSKLPR